MVVSLKANKKRILAFFILVAVVVGACVFLGKGGEEQPPKEIMGATNDERLTFLQGFGWQPDPEPAETREVMIPAKFNDVYTTYNVMQKAQGFDLKPYAGEICTQYKYRINNYPNQPEVYATLLVYGDLIIGGDVACAEANGFMHGFAPDSARYGETVEKTAKSESGVVSIAPESSSVQSAAVSSQPENSSSEMDTEASAAESGVESTAGDVIPEEAYPTD